MNQDFPSIDPKQFWSALASRATTAAIVTSSARGEPAGFFALSVTHLTWSPPIIMLSASNTTSALRTLTESGTVAVNYLREDDVALADIFSGKMGIAGAARFETTRWETMVTGAPVLESALGVLDCVVDEIIDRHGTAIVLAKIVAYRAGSYRDPLVHFQGSFTGLRDQA